jgi:hypothetical protein
MPYRTDYGIDGPIEHRQERVVSRLVSTHWFPRYSYRSAIAGSIRVAFHAGAKQAAADTINISTGTT